MKSQFTKEDAVSPVVGVMLMLVVTIVIAAAVAMFSTGLVDNTTPTPTAIIDYSGSNSKDGTLVFLHKGGDDFDLRDVTLILSRGEGSTPVEYTYSDYTYYIKSLDGDSLISAGEYFAAGSIHFGSGETVEYSLLQNGKTITSGKLVVPEGVITEPAGIYTLCIAGTDEMYTDEYGTFASSLFSGDAVTVSSGTQLLFYINGFDSSNKQVSKVGYSAVLIVEKGGSVFSTVRYTGPYYGFPVILTEPGTYTISGKVPSGITTSKHFTGTNLKTSEYVNYGGSSGTITVTVTA